MYLMSKEKKATRLSLQQRRRREDGKRRTGGGRKSKKTAKVSRFQYF